MERQVRPAVISRVIVALILLIASSEARAQTLGPAPPSAKLLAYRPGVARIEPRTVANEPAEEGWGLIVGDRNGILTIATPCHVVRNECRDRDKPALTETPYVVFNGLSQPVAARRSAADFGNVDLAILTVAKPAALVTISLPVIDLHDLQQLEQVFRLGSTDGWDVAGPGLYQNRVASDGYLRITDLSAAAGSSGSLALNDYGIVGMVLQSGSGNTYVLAASQIAELVTKAGFDANLLRAAPPPPPRPDDGRRQSIDELIFGQEITSPTLPVVPSVWRTVRSITYPTPASGTTLTLSGGSGSEGPATLEDTKLGPHEGRFSLTGWQITFSSRDLCGLGAIDGDKRTGYNIMQFQITPLYCRGGPGSCACGSGNVQGYGLTTYETLLQTSANAPKRRADAAPPPPSYRPPSDLTGQTWAFSFNGHDIDVTFGADHVATFSSPAFGASGRWQPEGRGAVAITTDTFEFRGTLTSEGDSMTLNIGRQGSFALVASSIEMHRVSDAAAPAAAVPSHVLPAPDMQPAAHLGDRKLVFDVGGPPLIVTLLPDHQVTLSDARYGSAGTWQSVGGVGFTISTPSRGLMGWFSQNGNGDVIGCNAIIRSLNGNYPPAEQVTCRLAD